MKKVVVANMKMQLTKFEVEEYINKLDDFKSNDIELIVCPSCLYLNLFNSSNYSIGSQNVFYENRGKYTGEISPIQLKDYFVKYVIVGHSERRRYFNETDDIINKKIKVCIDNDLKVILCIGEENENSSSILNTLDNQIELALENICNLLPENIIFAYEPVYAIGTNKSISNKNISYIVDYIKEKINKKYNFIPTVLYGGSVNENNIKDILLYCDGVMIGDFCLKRDKFIETINLL